MTNFTSHLSGHVHNVPKKPILAMYHIYHVSSPSPPNTYDSIMPFFFVLISVIFVLNLFNDTYDLAYPFCTPLIHSFTGNASISTIIPFNFIGYLLSCAAIPFSLFTLSWIPMGLFSWPYITGLCNTTLFFSS